MLNVPGWLKIKYPDPVRIWKVMLKARAITGRNITSWSIIIIIIIFIRTRSAQNEQIIQKIDRTVQQTNTQNKRRVNN